MEYERRGAGGTSGGLGEFIVGAILAALGLYLIFDRITVTTGFWSFGGVSHPFGVLLVPLIFGIGTLFVNGRSTSGWVLTGGSLLFMVAGVLLNMDIAFQRTSLTILIVMVATMAAGFGLIFKSLRPH